MYRIAGFIALIALAAALNLFAWTRSAIHPAVLLSLAVAAVAGLAWLILLFTSGSARSVLEGRAIGGLNAVVSSLLFLGICVVAYAFIAANDQSWDLTREGRRELSAQTIQVLQGMDTEVRVIGFFLDVEDELVVIGRQKTQRFIEQCQQYTNLLKWELKDPQVAVAEMEALGINFASPQGTVVIKSGARQRVITLQGGSPRLEEREFTNALINVLRDAVPAVYYLQGHGEPDPADAESRNGAGGIRKILANESYELVPFTINPSDPLVPTAADIVLINDPQGDLRKTEIDALDAFLDRGGRLLIMLNPWVRVEQGLAQREFLRPWLAERFGIEVGSDLVLSGDPQAAYAAVLSYEHEPFLEVDEVPPAYRGSFHSSHPITRGFDQIMQWQPVRTVDVTEDKPADVAAVKLIRTLPSTYAETRISDLQEGKQPTKDPDERDGPLPIVVAAAQEREQHAEDGRPNDARVVVIGNAAFASNSEITFPGNINFFLNVFAWMSESEDLIAIRPSGITDPPLLLDDTQERVIIWVSCLLLLQVFALAGIAMHYLRSRNT